MAVPLWQPSEARVAAANLTRFRREAAVTWGLDLPDHAALYRWSIAEPAQFWQTVWSFCEVVAAHQGATALVDGDRMPGARFFPDARLNFAENLLRAARRRADAIVFWGEDKVKRRLTHADELYAAVSRLRAGAAARRASRPGDRVAGYLPNMPETIIAMLGDGQRSARSGRPARRISASQGVLDRFGQIEPRVLVRRRRLLLQRQDHSIRRQGRARSSRGCRRCETRGRRAVSRSSRPALAGDLRRRATPFVGRLPRAARRGADRLRAAAVRPSALHPVLVRHHRRAEVHRARRRRHAAAAPEGAPAALRRRSPATASSTSRPAAG